MDQMFLINEKKNLHELPSAKVRKNDRVGRNAWINFYAAYSESFSDAVFEALGVERGDVVFDPFVGSGTSAISAQKIQASFVGWDLDPFACLLSRAKVATNVDIEKVERYLTGTTALEEEAIFSPQAYEIFDEQCLNYAAGVFSKIRKKVRVGKKSFLERVCSDAQGKYDSEVVAVVVLCIASSRAAKLVKGSNPTWYRKGVTGEFDFVGRLKEEVSTVFDSVSKDLVGNAKFVKGKYEFTNCDAAGVGDSLPDNSVDYVVTSPPYLTRIDYVVNHLPNLILLSGLMLLDIDVLRSHMIGTSKIVDKNEPDMMWGKTCLGLLVSIFEHKSYASKRYYYWTYVQYFRSIYRALLNVSKKLKPRGKGVLVVQSSFYKEVHVPLSDIILEMMEGMGLRGEVIRREAVKVNMRSLQTSRSGSNVSQKSSTEDLIFFTKN